jgi:hypothetical protein
MTLSDFQDTYSWQGAIALGSQLLSLAEELPAAEASGLALQLRQLTVDVPAGVAADLLGGMSANLTPALKLITVLELIDRIYPAIDVADVRAAADELAGRLSSDAFAEVQAAPVAPVAADVAAPSAAEPETAEFDEPAAAPTVAELAATPVQPFEISMTTASNPQQSEDTDVHPDSVQ